MQGLRLFCVLICATAFTPYTQGISSGCLDAVAEQLESAIIGCSKCYRETGASAEAARRCCTRDGGCIHLLDGLVGVIRTTEECTEADSESFDLSVTGVFLSGQLGDVCQREAEAGNIGTEDSSGPEGDACSPAGSGSRRKLCMVHNDPHVLKFDYAPGQMLTCDVVGNMTLVDTDHFRISAVGAPIPPQISDTENEVPGASIVTSVTFSYKNSTCGDDVTLDDTGTYTAAGMRTTVSTRARQTSEGQRFLAVTIETPFAQGSTGICSEGCPDNEVDIRPAFNESTPATRKLLQGSNSTSAYEQAREACKDEGLEGDWLDACAHDSTYSRDPIFNESVRDDKRAYNEARDRLEDEDGGDGAGADGMSGASRVGLGLWVLVAGSLLVSTLLYSMV